MQLSNSLTPRSIASSNYLLRQYGGAAAAYSLQRLDTSVDNVVRVRRSTDDAETDFTAQEVAGGVLASFCGAGDGFVTTLYDQSGALGQPLSRFAQHATAADTRMYFDGSAGNYISFPTFSNQDFYGCDVTFYNAETINSSTAAQVLLNFDTSGSTFSEIAFGASTGIWPDEVITLTLPTGSRAAVRNISISSGVHTLSVRWNSVTSQFDITLDGVAQTVTNAGAQAAFTAPNLQIGGPRAFFGTQFKGIIYDVSIFDSGLDAYLTVNGYGNTNADWEDQVGSNDGTVNGSPSIYEGRNALQATAASQPQIVADGVVVTDADGIPAMSFDGVNDKLGVSGETIITGDSTGEWSGFSVQEITIADIGFVYGNTVGGGAGTSLRIVTSPTSYTVSNATTTADYIARGLTKDLVSTCYNNGDAKLKLNGGGTPVSGSYTYTAATLDFTIGDWPNSSVANSAVIGKISEIVIYPTDKSANRVAIEANIGSRYGITTGYADLYLEALQTAGASPTSTQANAIKNFVRTGESEGWFSSLKRFYLPIWGAAGPNAIDLISRASGTFNGSVTHGAGYVQGDGSTGYFDFGVSPSTLGLTIDGGSAFALVSQADSRNVEAQFVGCTDSFNRRVYLQQQSSSGIQATLYSAITTLNDTVTPNGIIMAVVRSATDRFSKVKNTAGISTATNVNSNTTTTCEVNAFAMAVNNKGSGIIEASDSRLGAYGLGHGFTEAQAENYMAALELLWETTTGLTLP
jgi:hypothetical protein